MGNLGYNETNYMANFGGTSAACPQVSGVAALMLSVRPDLTETQVRTILQNTARDLGTPGFDDTYGYGLVDANAAVRAAIMHGVVISGPSHICDQATYTITNIPDSATAQWSSSGNLTRISAQGAIPCTFAATSSGTTGNGWVEATIIYNSDTLTTLRKEIHIGPETPSIHGTEYPAVWCHATYTVDTPISEWVITPTEGVITRATGNKMDVIFRKTGEYQIGARTNNGCGYGSFAYRNLNVLDFDSIFGTPEISYYSSIISGPSEICDNAAFSINVPPGATIIWFCEGKISQVSPQGSNPCIFSPSITNAYGEGKIGAVVFIQDTPYRVHTKNITVGTPNNISITGNMFPANYQYETYTALTDYTNLSWNIIPSSGVSMIPRDNQVDIMFTDGGTYQLGVKALNSCGYGSYTYHTISVADSLLSISFDPSTSIISVEMRSSLETIQQDKRKSKSGETYEIQLWSATAFIRRYTTSQRSYQLSIADLPKGIYIIRIIKNGKIKTKKIIR